MMRHIIIRPYTLSRLAWILWRNENRLFWVRADTSRRLRHAGVMYYTTYSGACNGARQMGGVPRYENELPTLHEPTIRQPKGVSQPAI